MKFHLYRFLTFTKTEQRGSIALVIIILVVIIFPHAYNFFFQESGIVITPQEVALMDSFEQQYAQLLAEDENDDHAYRPFKNALRPAYQLFTFDPNTLNDQGWQQLGLSERQVLSIRKFIDKGGRFRKPEDITKLFVLSDEKKAELLPYVRIASNDYQGYNFEKRAADTVSAKHVERFPFDPNKIGIAEWLRLGLSEKQAQTMESFKNKGGHFYKPEDLRKIFVLDSVSKESLLPWVQIEKTSAEKHAHQAFTLASIDINLADSATFEKLHGIGPTIASRIISYREKLGGFVHIKQLKEVNGFHDSLYASLRPLFIRDKKFEVRKINVNTATYEQLRDHPYIGGHNAYWIRSYIRNNQPFKTVDEVHRVSSITDNQWEKIRYYISVE